MLLPPFASKSNDNTGQTKISIHIRIQNMDSSKTATMIERSLDRHFSCLLTFEKEPSGTR